MKRTELIVLVIVMTVAAGFRLVGLDSAPPGLYPDEAMVGTEAQQAWRTKEFKVFYPYNNGEEGLYANLVSLSVAAFGNTAFAIRLTSAIIGILTVLGTYFLARQLFDNWQLAAMAAFLMATGFWHVNFSRIGFRAILSPLMAVWAFYFLFKGLRTHRLWHWALAGLFLGLGMYSYLAFRVMPVVAAIVILTFWWAIRTSFGHPRYAYTRGQFWGNVACMVSVALVVTIPLALYFVQHPGDFTVRAAQLSVFSSEHPFSQLAINFVKQLGMFFFEGDHNWRHNISGAPVLFWPIAALFAVGLIRGFLKIGRTMRTHGHPSIPQVFLLSWFFIGILPAAISNEGIPHALRSLIVAPAVYIIAGEGLWWLVTWARHWYDQRETYREESDIAISIAMIALLTALAITEAYRYSAWAHNPITARYFNQNYVDIADRLNALPVTLRKYVVVRDGPVNADGFAIAARTVMFLTDSATPEQQKKTNVRYLHENEFRRHLYPAGSFVVQLDP